MRKVLDLVRDSTIAQGTITVALTGTACYLWAAQQPVPQELWTALTVVLGFFFGAKVQQAIK